VKEKHQHILHQAEAQKEETRKVFAKWKKKRPSDLDERFHTLHEQVFAKTDCLGCANCCKTTSPIFRDVDVRRIANKLKVQEARFIQTYLRMDEDGDWVLKNSPCAFLGSDNKCGIYEFRPQACREYPHTDRRKMVQILDLTARNALMCPAVAEIVLELTKD
jgi:hypothetical protein